MGWDILFACFTFMRTLKPKWKVVLRTFKTVLWDKTDHNSKKKKEYQVDYQKKMGVKMCQSLFLLYYFRYFESLTSTLKDFSNFNMQNLL